MSEATAGSALGPAARSFVWLASGEVLAKGCGFVAFALLARSLGPTAYGALEVAVAFGMVGLLVVDFGLGPTAARAMTTEPAERDAVTGSVPTIRLALAVAVLAAAVLLAPWLAPTPDARRLLVLFSSALLLAPAILDWVFQGLDRTVWVAPAQLLRMGTFLAGVVLFVDGPDDLARVGWIEIAGFAVLATYYVLATRRLGERPGLRPDRSRVRALVRESLPVGAGQVLWVANQYLPTLVLAIALAGTAPGERAELAYYGAAHRVVFGLGSFVFLYFFTLYPALVRTTHDERAAFAPLMARSLRATAWLGAGLGVAGTVLARPLVTLAFGDAFERSATLLATLVWVLPIHLLSGHARFALIAAGHADAHLRAQAIGVAVTLIGCVASVAAFGAAGAVGSVLVAALAVWVAAHRAMAGLGLPLPGPGLLLRPAGAALLAIGIGAGWPGEERVAPILVPLVGFLALAGWHERATLRELASGLHVDGGAA